MKNVIVKFRYYGESKVVEVLEIDGHKEEEMVFFNLEDLVEFLPEFLKDFYNTTNYTLQKA